MTIQPGDPLRTASSSRLDRQVAQYSLVAAVAGVSLLALAQPAQGEVVITKKTIPIQSGGLGIAIDINHDGISDFVFYSSSDFGSGRLSMKGHGEVVGTFYASALTRGAKIGPSDRFGAATTYSTVRIERGGLGDSGKFFGNWGGNPKNRYLGVQFVFNGEKHYGWIRLTVVTSLETGITGTITAYAYESTPNKPIFAGVPEKPAGDDAGERDKAEAKSPSLGMLAAGAEGIPLWRREGASALH